jgi:DNA-binding NtrC family response regulator
LLFLQWYPYIRFMNGGGSAGYKVLLVDDDPLYRSSLRRLLEPEGCQIVEAGDGAAALEVAGATRVDLAFVDVRMPGMGGLELLHRLRASHPSLPVVMLTAYADVGMAVGAMKAGATDLLEKNAAVESIRARIAQARRIWELEQDNQRLRSVARQEFDFPALLGTSPSMLGLKEAIARVGPSDASVLIEGETGTGKELVARAIHHHSRRHAGPFIPVDCASISESLMESELFGHVKGAYTGANEGDIGLIRSADGGTVFLDELGEIPLSMQVKLLRVIQEREVRPVGSPRSQRVDIRVIAATNRVLSARIAQGAFREDLYYRVAVVTLEIPPLRERGEDIALLSQSFLDRVADPASPPVSLEAAALERLRAYAWPGNVRELENVIHRAMVMHRGPRITPADLPAALRDGREPSTAASAPPAAPVPAPSADGGLLAAYEKAAIVNALERSAGSRREAARILGIGEATLYRKLHLYALAPAGAERTAPDPNDRPEG